MDARGSQLMVITATEWAAGSQDTLTALWECLEDKR
jgi:hypothetical protein